MENLLKFLDLNTLGILEGQFRSSINLSKLKDIQNKHNHTFQNSDEEIIFARNPSGLLDTLKISEIISMTMVDMKKQEVTLFMKGYNILLQFIGDTTGTFHAYKTNYKEVRDQLDKK